MDTIFPGKSKASKTSTKHDNDLDLSHLRFKMNRTFLNNVDKYSWFDDPNHNCLSYDDLVTLTFDIKLKVHKLSTFLIVMPICIILTISWIESQEVLFWGHLVTENNTACG